MALSLHLSRREDDLLRQGREVEGIVMFEIVVLAGLVGLRAAADRRSTPTHLWIVFI